MPVPRSERWTVMSRTPSEGGYGWLTIIAGPHVGEDGETFEVMRAEVTDEMVERVAREMASWSGPVPVGVDGFRPYAERVVLAAFSTSQEGTR